MAFITIFIGLVLIVSQSDDARLFSQHSNKIPEYKFVSVKCEGGLHDSGYSIPIDKKVFFKQINKDGTIGSVCKNNN
ncbi:hypothetical protein N9C75_01445 [Alphaproteobacteria bacterium]|jgi:hypothetical protein|nr:hypothetical protein [Alphaproteobacteria bacterium]MBT5798374.1 hypothetical protein [Alphaproteobacteria bacterium]MDA9189973.1 hypothetical protein [Alphaproteobacteria bacterium]MDA9815699.1 hypothetical protein [Alphaproteobacteria bacterium]MDC0462127.1 hypothetical protein [Alphaproteobacteria bacterium]